MRNHRTHRRVLTAVALASLVLLAACDPPPPPSPSSPAAADIVERHNYIRGINGVAPLAVDGGAQANAQFHADRLAAGATSCTNALWHTPSSDMVNLYPGQASGENLACVPGCPADGKQAFDLWMRSPGHYDNVVRPSYAYIGVATQCTGSVMIVVAHYRSG